jgi:double-strand break repair protein MRE11
VSATLAAGNFNITQPGSSVVTSLIEGEAKKKQVLLLEVRCDDDNPDGAPFWRTNPIPLETTRPFKYKQMSLTECARAPVEEGGLGPDWTNQQTAGAAAAGASARGRAARGGGTQHEAWVHDLLERNVNEMIVEATAPYVARDAAPADIPLPLVRLRVDYSGGFSTINGQRFGQKFVGKVANPNDLLQFHKSAVRRKKEEDGATGARGNAGMGEDEETIGNPQLQDQRRIEQLVNSNLTSGLQLLSENDMSNALDDFVNRDTTAIHNLIQQRLAETQALVEEEGDVDELGNPDDAKKR